MVGRDPRVRSHRRWGENLGECGWQETELDRESGSKEQGGGEIYRVEKIKCKVEKSRVRERLRGGKWAGTSKSNQTEKQGRQRSG